MSARDALAGWPDALVDALCARRGRPVSLEPLAGMSASTVLRARWSDGASAVIKRGPAGAEARFYARVAPALRAEGVRLPALLALCAPPDTAEAWLALEDLPAPLPRERWLADPDVLGNLARLHAAPRALADPPPGGAPGASGASTAPWFRAAWPRAASAAAEAALPAAARARLEALRQAAEPLFAPLAPLSGDPNPRNWGVRAGGEAVLFDWERFGPGHPALDLAIAVPGLGTPDDFARTARGYAAAAADLPPGRAAPALPGAREIALAKAWNVVEFLDLAQRAPGVDRAVVSSVQAALSSWVDALAAFAL